MSKNISLFLFIVYCLCAKISVASHLDNVLKKDTITYRAQVWVEKEDLVRYGGEEIFKKNLEEMFAHTTSFWNDTPNKFNYYFRFVPSGLKIYDNQGDQDNYDKNIKEASGILDTIKFDFVVFFALNAKNNGMWCSSGKSRQAVVACFKTFEEQRKNGDIFSKRPPEHGVYGDLGHEFGHFRGATDIYQYMIKAKDNPINHIDLTPPQSIMRYAQDRVWDEYCSALFNYTAQQKQMEKDLNRKVFPDKLRIKVLVKGKTKKNVTVKFYGTRAGGEKNNRDVYPKAFRTFSTDKVGHVDIPNVYKLYHVDHDDIGIPPKDEFPYRYWFSFLVEAEYKGEKKYIWIPDWQTQITKLKGGNIHEAVIEFK
ncbi:hypothetical protein H9X96_19850 [Pedobacter sp. N36a]|uniref:hypothetical protein n=1 Tax=Pedobacter sp. N36a TaxID=2767996 RepID=UPI00165750D2|nr:hypothetical protein [Pedobacter sp. N36a]MBC8988015.1 hypothetical protein [Pedobacter sp. N36a]